MRRLWHRAGPARGVDEPSLMSVPSGCGRERPGRRRPADNVAPTFGGVAQLVERLTGSQEVRGFESLRLHSKMQVGWGWRVSLTMARTWPCQRPANGGGGIGVANVAEAVADVEAFIRAIRSYNNDDERLLAWLAEEVDQHIGQKIAPAADKLALVSSWGEPAVTSKALDTDGGE